MPDSITPTTTQTPQGPIIEKELPPQEDGSADDGDTQGTPAGATSDTREVPTPKDVADATRTSGDDSGSTEDQDGEEDQDGGDDADDQDHDGEPSPKDVAKLLAKVRRTNRENKSLRERATNAERELGQLRAAMQTGLPLEMATRLRGSTEEELRADAESLLKVVGRRSAPGWGPDDGVRRGDGRATRPEDETDLDKVGSRIYGG